MTPTFADLLAQGRALQARIAARMDGVPNLRDYGLERRADYERDITTYHAETARMTADLNEIVRQRHAARALEVSR